MVLSALHPVLAISLRTVLPGVLEFLVVTAVAFVVICLLVSHMRFEKLTLLAADAERKAMNPADAFVVRIADRLGRPPRERCDFAVMLLAFAPGRTIAPAQCSGFLRANDLVTECGAGILGLLMDSPREGAEPAARRLAEAIAGLGPLAAGIATTPENGLTAQGLAEAAADALREARATHTGFQTCMAQPLPVKPAPGETGEEAPIQALIPSDALPTALQRFVARRRKETLAVALVHVGIDHFDRYLEQYGSEGAEQVAEGVAEMLLGNVRRGDLVGRHETHTFVLALECGCRHAVAVAERLSPRVRKAVFHAGTSGVKVAISAGVTAYPEHGGLPHVLFDKARIAGQTAEQQRKVCLVYHRSMRGGTMAGQQKDVL